MQIHFHSFTRLHSLGAFCWSSDPVCGFTSRRALPVEWRECNSPGQREYAESILGPSTAITLSWKVWRPVIPETPWGFLRHREASHLLQAFLLFYSCFLTSHDFSFCLPCTSCHSAPMSLIVIIVRVASIIVLHSKCIVCKSPTPDTIIYNFSIL